MSCRVFFFSRGLREVVAARISVIKSVEHPKILLVKFSWKSAAEFIARNLLCPCPQRVDLRTFAVEKGSWKTTLPVMVKVRNETECRGKKLEVRGIIIARSYLSEILLL